MTNRYSHKRHYTLYLPEDVATLVESIEARYADLNKGVRFSVTKYFAQAGAEKLKVDFADIIAEAREEARK